MNILATLNPAQISSVPDSLNVIPPVNTIPTTMSAIDAEYLEILEKTNQQLSLLYNPYGIMIATLGVLFAVLGIVAAIVIWRQGNSYQKLVEDSIAEHKKVLTSIIVEQIEIFKAEINRDLVATQKKELKATPAEKDKLAKDVQELRAKLDEINRTDASNFVEKYSPESFWSGGTAYNIHSPIDKLRRLMMDTPTERLRKAVKDSQGPMRGGE